MPHYRLTPLFLARAQRVDQALPKAAIKSRWLSGYELAVRANVPYRSVSDIIGYLREQQPDEPILSGAYGYKRSFELTDISAYTNYTKHHTITRWRRHFKGAETPYLRYLEQNGLADTRQIKFIKKQYEHVIEYMLDLLPI